MNVLDRSASKLVRVGFIAACYLAATAATQTAGATSGAVGAPRVAADTSVYQCHICLSDLCPFDLPSFDAACQQSCGPQSFAGACYTPIYNDPYLCGSHPAVICYEPQ